MESTIMIISAKTVETIIAEATDAVMRRMSHLMCVAADGMFRSTVTVHPDGSVKSGRYGGSQTWDDSDSITVWDISEQAYASYGHEYLYDLFGTKNDPEGDYALVAEGKGDVDVMHVDGETYGIITYPDSGRPAKEKILHRVSFDPTNFVHHSADFWACMGDHTRDEIEKSIREWAPEHLKSFAEAAK